MRMYAERTDMHLVNPQQPTAICVGLRLSAYAFEMCRVAKSPVLPFLKTLTGFSRSANCATPTCSRRLS